MATQVKFLQVIFWKNFKVIFTGKNFFKVTEPFLIHSLFILNSIMAQTSTTFLSKLKIEMKTFSFKDG